MFNSVNQRWESRSRSKPGTLFVPSSTISLHINSTAIKKIKIKITNHKKKLKFKCGVVG